MRQPSKPGAQRIVACPRCKGDSVFGPQNPYRPFCGERCKAFDFGAWADEGFRLPAHSAKGEDDAPAPPPLPLQ
ncbi:MAG: DNA gyrase inhibitor YacG [Rhodoferax sp.]|nr:DNA gyrase inhibitor YacG [Rhodoferax sp.]